MKILHLNYYDVSGGASIAAYRIHKSLIKESVNSQMYVSEKKIKTLVLFRQIKITLIKLIFVYRENSIELILIKIMIK